MDLVQMATCAGRTAGGAVRAFSTQRQRSCEARGKKEEEEKKQSHEAAVASCHVTEREKQIIHP